MTALGQQYLPGTSPICPGEIIVDLFAGGGGASIGIEDATGRSPEVAINHSAIAISCHSINHPTTQHFQTDIREVHPQHATNGAPVAALHASPDCRHFSRAKGGKPVSKSVRSLANVVIRWARIAQPRIITLENVPEFVTWGPLKGNRPDPLRIGQSFHRWVFRLRRLGYEVEWRRLRACDFGTPTTRERLFVIARRDGHPVAWPTPSHGSGLQPYRTAAECIDWNIPTRSIFGRKKPLAEATCRRIAAGLVRHVLQSPAPFIVRSGHTQDDPAKKIQGLNRPLTTIVTKNSHMLVSPYVVPLRGTSKAHRSTRQVPEPLSTITSGGQHHALVAAFLAKHYTGVVGQDLRAPLGTVTSVDHHSLVAAFLVKYYGTGGQDQRLDDPMHAITTIARHGLVVVHIDGEPYRVVDIGMRMLEPHELAKAQGLPDGYALPKTKRDAIKLIGNSVCPPVIRAIYEANLHPESKVEAA